MVLLFQTKFIHKYLSTFLLLYETPTLLTFSMNGTVLCERAEDRKMTVLVVGSTYQLFYMKAESTKYYNIRNIHLWKTCLSVPIVNLCIKFWARCLRWSGLRLTSYCAEN